MKRKPFPKHIGGIPRSFVKYNIVSGSRGSYKARAVTDCLGITPSLSLRTRLLPPLIQLTIRKQLSQDT